MIAWNKGSSLLQNSQQELGILIDKFKPDILTLSEANLKNDIETKYVSIDNYTLHTAPTINNQELNISRVVVYTHSNVIVKRRHDLEDDRLATIWLELRLPGKKKTGQCIQRMAVLRSE